MRKLRVLTLLLMISWMVFSVGKAEASRRPASTELLVPEARLTRGVVLSIPKASFSKPAYLNYWDGKEIANKVPFVVGVQVLSASGFDEEALNDLNSSAMGSKLYVTLGSLSQASLLWEDAETALVSVTGGITIYEDQEAIESEELGVEEGDDLDSGAVEERPQTRPPTRPVGVNQQGDSSSATPLAPPTAIRPKTRPTNMVTPSRPAVYQLSRHSDTWLRAGVPEPALRDALSFARQNASRISNKRYIIIADFTAHSNTRRLFLLDSTTGRVERYYTSHGVGSDPGHTGYAKIFSNKNGSKYTPAGFHITEFRQSAKHGRSILLRGLETKNSNSVARGILIHKAAYVTEAFISKIKKAGRSHGCLALEPQAMNSFLQRVSTGVLVYHYTGR